MSFETFAGLHPIGYVLMAYTVVWVLHFGFALWIWREWRKTPRA